MATHGVSFVLIAHDYNGLPSRYTALMETDALKRRLRFSKPQPAGKRITVHDADMVVFEALHRHGPLPTPYLHEFAKHLSRNRNAFQYRLTKLYNGAEKSAALLSRPPQQFASYEARYQHVIYDLTRASRALLAERDTYYAPEKADPFLHRFMGACVSASIELACREAGIRYITKEEILSRQTCPETTRRSSNPLAINTGDKTLIPDDLFGLQYPDKSYRFFAVEIDRNTESIERRNLTQNTFGKKIDYYLQLFYSRAFKDHWGVPNLLVLIVTTNVTHLQNLIECLAKLTDGQRSERFLFKAKSEFGINWKVPPIMTDLLTEPWRRADMGPLFINRA